MRSCCGTAIARIAPEMLVEFLGLRRYGKGARPITQFGLDALLDSNAGQRLQPPGQRTTERNGSRLRISCHRPGRIAGCPSWA
jgi:hypothetical protein